MRPADHNLKELLFEFDCVTIPGLGGFIMQNQPARIDRGKNRIHPPSRHPSFNSLLNHDDGLLISSISRAEHISYEEAALIVSDFVHTSKKRILSGENVSLEGIGELSSSPDGGFRFRQSSSLNFMAGAFGMEALNLYPVSKALPQNRSTKKPADRKPVPAKDKKPASVKWTLALSIPVILFLLYGIIFPSSVHNIYTSYSGLFSGFSHPESSPTAVTVTSQAEAPVVSDTIAATAPTPVNVPEVNKETIAKPLLPVAPKYYIIGGCFENEGNAAKFLAELISRGFEAERAGTTGSGHIRISYKSFPGKSSALSYLQKIRTEENASAWLLKY